VEEEKQSVQNELDDLLMVFGDLEEKVAKYKVRAFYPSRSDVSILIFHSCRLD
jgi:hypothetical protein